VLEDKVVACDLLTQFHPMHLGFILVSPSISLHLGSVLSLMSFSLSKFYGIPPERLSLEDPVLRYIVLIPLFTRKKNAFISLSDHTYIKFGFFNFLT